MLDNKIMLNVAITFTLLFVSVHDVRTLKLSKIAKKIVPSKGLEKVGDLVSETVSIPAQGLDKIEDVASKSMSIAAQGLDKIEDAASKAMSISKEGLDKVEHFVSKAVSSNGTILNCFGLPIGIFSSAIERIFTQTTKAEDVRFYFYTPNPPVNVTVHADDDFQLKDLSFQQNLTTVVISHGFLSHGKEDWIMQMKDAFLKLVRNIIFSIFLTPYYLSHDSNCESTTIVRSNHILCIPQFCSK